MTYKELAKKIGVNYFWGLGNLLVGTVIGIFLMLVTAQSLVVKMI